MNAAALLESFLKTLGNDRQYFISGSFSFLPMLGDYRNTEDDLDACVRRDVFEKRREQFLQLGKMSVLRLKEVAIAPNGILPRWFSPQTGFIHIETEHGRLDLSLYEETEKSLSLILGRGFRFQMAGDVLKHINYLKHDGWVFRAGPPEMMFLAKLIGYLQAKKTGALLEYKKSKHWQDLVKIKDIVDWGYIDDFYRSLRVTWLGMKLPKKMERSMNPFQGLELEKLRSEISADGWSAIRSRPAGSGRKKRS